MFGCFLYGRQQILLPVNRFVRAALPTFGKHELKTGGNNGLNTDLGYFGSGVYFTDSAQYAADCYNNQNLLFTLVSMRNPYPVMADRVCTHTTPHHQSPVI